MLLLPYVNNGNSNCKGRIIVNVQTRTIIRTADAKGLRYSIKCIAD